VSCNVNDLYSNKELLQIKLLHWLLIFTLKTKKNKNT
jgi:hypothetical protein